MKKDNYKYYLANGECLEYSLSPGCSLVAVIDEITAFYYASYGVGPNYIWVRPDIAHQLNIECAKRYFVLGNLPQPNGASILQINTYFGPVTVIAKPNIEFPIFFGSEQEYKDNSFNVSMEIILA